jgi:hypothetical protein
VPRPLQLSTYIAILKGAHGGALSAWMPSGFFCTNNGVETVRGVRRSAPSLMFSPRAMPGPIDCRGTVGRAQAARRASTAPLPQDE